MVYIYKGRNNSTKLRIRLVLLLGPGWEVEMQ